MLKLIVPSERVTVAIHKIMLCTHGSLHPIALWHLQCQLPLPWHVFDRNNSCSVCCDSDEQVLNKCYTPRSPFTAAAAAIAHRISCVHHVERMKESEREWIMQNIFFPSSYSLSYTCWPLSALLRSRSSVENCPRITVTLPCSERKCHPLPAAAGRGAEEECWSRDDAAFRSSMSARVIRTPGWRRKSSLVFDSIGGITRQLGRWIIGLRALKNVCFILLIPTVNIHYMHSTYLEYNNTHHMQLSPDHSKTPPLLRSKIQGSTSIRCSIQLIPICAFMSREDRLFGSICLYCSPK